MNLRHGRGPRDQGCRACLPRDQHFSSVKAAKKMKAEAKMNNIDEELDYMSLSGSVVSVISDM